MSIPEVTLKLCKNCNNVLTDIRVKHNKKFCSNKCKQEYFVTHISDGNKPLTGNVLICLNCFKQYYRTISEQKRHNKQYCSHKCFSEIHSKNMKGEGNPAYIDNRVRESGNLYVSDRWKQLRKTIYKRDDYKCKLCGEKNKRLHAHHIISGKICDDFYDERNLITVCYLCHDKIHRGLI